MQKTVRTMTLFLTLAGLTLPAYAQHGGDNMMGGGGMHGGMEMEGMHSGAMMERMDGMLEQMGEMMAEMHGGHQESAGEAHEEQMQMQMMGGAGQHGAEGSTMNLVQEMNGEMERILPAMESMLKQMREYMAGRSAADPTTGEIETMMTSMEKMMGSGQTLVTTLRAMDGGTESSAAAPAGKESGDHPRNHQH